MEDDQIPLLITEAQWNKIYNDLYELTKQFAVEGTTEEQIQYVLNALKNIFTIDESQPLQSVKNLN